MGGFIYIYIYVTAQFSFVHISSYDFLCVSTSMLSLVFCMPSCESLNVRRLVCISIKNTHTCVKDFYKSFAQVINVVLLNPFISPHAWFSNDSNSFFITWHVCQKYLSFSKVFKKTWSIWIALNLAESGQ